MRGKASDPKKTSYVAVDVSPRATQLRFTRLYVVASTFSRIQSWYSSRI
jgi:hypothetical protein